MALTDLGDDERRDDRWQDPETRLREPEARAALGDDEVCDSTQAHPAAKRGALHPRDDRDRAGVDGLEHVGHAHRVLLVALDVERARRPHPVEVRAGAERRPVAREDHAAQIRRRLPRKGRERRSQLGDERRIERVVDLRAGQRHPGDRRRRARCVRGGRRGLIGAIVTTTPRRYARVVLIGIDHLVIAVADPDEAASTLESGLGLTPGGGGRHEALGTFNRLVWLGDTYLELIGVFDAKLAAASWIGAPASRAIDAGGGLAAWAVASDDLRNDVAALRERGSDLSIRSTASASGRTVRSFDGGSRPLRSSIRSCRHS